MPRDFAGRRVTVMGLGRFGGGIGVTRFLANQGAHVLVTDQSSPDDLSDSVQQLADLSGQVTFRLGTHETEDFTQADLVIANPAVKPGNPFIQAARDADVPVTSEIRLLVERLPNPQRVIGVTGSAGKSTTTSMIGHALNKLAPHPVHLGGNLGGSLLPTLDRIRPDDWVVLELSSFMLDGLDEDHWSPHIAVVTNLSPNHLDWHGSMDAYAAAKQTILEHQRLDHDDVCVLGEAVAQAMRPMVPRAMLPKQAVSIQLAIPGAHNRDNAHLAVTACAAAGYAPQDAAEALADFPGLPHRLQFVGEREGVRYYNDSKSTTPQAAVLALQAFEPGICHVILGGYDKGSDLAGLAQLAAEHAKAVYTVGATGDAIADAAEAWEQITARPDTCGGVAWPAERAAVVRCGGLDQAVRAIGSAVQPGEVVLLSPGCASWGQFANYQARGEAFVTLTTESGA